MRPARLIDLTGFGKDDAFGLQLRHGRRHILYTQAHHQRLLRRRFRLRGGFPTARQLEQRLCVYIFSKFIRSSQEKDSPHTLQRTKLTKDTKKKSG